MDKEIKKELDKSIKNVIKQIPHLPWLPIFLILALFFIIYAFNFRMEARSTGGAIGEGAGRIVGKAIGSFEGITNGQIEGYEAGVHDAQNVTDIPTELSNKFEEVGLLEVMVASGTFSDVLTIGQNKDYAALIAMDYNAVYTIDLKNAHIEYDKNNAILNIEIDTPKLNFYPTGEVRKLKEYQKDSFIVETGSAEAGYIDADNSINQMRPNAERELSSNSGMKQSAKNAAINQLENLVKAVSVTPKQINIMFREVANE